MYRRIKYFFTNNFYWKALSVFMAIVLWFVVMNINNPTEIKSFTLNISLLHEDKLLENNLSILNIEELKAQKAEIKIKGTRTTLDELNKRYNKENIKLTLDLEQILSYKIGDEPLEATINLKPIMPNIAYPNNNFEIVSFYPLTSNIYIDKVITIPKKIHPKTIGETKSGYISSEPELSSEYIQVTGAKSIVDKIQVIYAEVDITDKTSTIKENVKPVAYDKDGNKITDIKFNMDNVEIKVPISVEGFINIVEPNLVGKLPEGYIVEDISYSPKTVEVVGSTTNLKKLTKINLPNIDITGLTQSTQFTYDVSSILKQYNLKTKNNSSSNIKINIVIKEAATKSINIPTNKISILGYDDSFFIDMPEQVVLNVTGEETIINNLDETLLKCSIDVTNLNIGEHNVKVNVDLPEGVKFVSEPYFNITITNKKENQQIEINEETKYIEEQSSQETIEEETKIMFEEITETTSQIEQTGESESTIEETTT